jgi:hypothetical protein
MKKIINLMVNMFGIREYGLDFMGFRVTDWKKITYHHLIIKEELGGKKTVNNGVILIDDSHKYLNFIEKKDKEIFDKITFQLILENRKRRINLENLIIIDKLLLEFEKKYKLNRNIYPTRFLREIDKDILDNIDKYELKKNLPL